jgi:hypothetical protein
MAPDEQNDDESYLRTEDEQSQPPPHPNNEQSHEADDEAETPSKQAQETEYWSLPSLPSITRKVIKRISGGQENDPALLAGAREHRILALNVQDENADEMRAFEAKQDPDLLRLWSINIMKERIGITCT